MVALSTASSRKLKDQRACCADSEIFAADVLTNAPHRSAYEAHFGATELGERGQIRGDNYDFS